MLNNQQINKIKNLVNEFNDFISKSTTRNDDMEVGVILTQGTWEEAEHYTKAEFFPDESKIVLNYWETSKPNIIKSDEYVGLDEYDGTGLKDGLRNMKKIMKKIDKELQKNKINEAISLLEKITKRKVSLKTLTL